MKITQISVSESVPTSRGETLTTTIIAELHEKDNVDECIQELKNTFRLKKYDITPHQRSLMAKY